MSEKEITPEYSTFLCFITQDFLRFPLPDAWVVTSFSDPEYHTIVVLSVLSWAAGVEISTLVISNPAFFK